MDIEELQEEFPGVDFGFYLKPNYNVAPSQAVLAIPNFENRKALPFHWGLIPPWSKDKNIGYKMINARAETLSEKPNFRKPFQNQRCLILANGFYEWKKEGDIKQPYYIRLKSGKPFAFAGLWEKWTQSGHDPLFSCTIITTEANDLLASLHQRMPVILQPNHYQLWLDSGVSKSDRLSDLLLPYDPDKMTFHPVSTLVNSPRNNNPDCVKALVA
jgi:putative SOS response-associated peptidase YedK